MAKNQLVEIIKAHPEISYEEGWRQALQAGLCSVDFQGAWAEAHGAGSPSDPDFRVQMILGEMRRSDKEGWALQDWKGYGAEKEIPGEECELAFSLSRARGALGPLTTRWMRRMMGLLAVLAIVFGFWVGRQSDSGWLSGMAWTLGSLFLYFVCFLALGAQFRDNTLKIVEYELGARPVNPMAMLSAWGKAGFGFLGAPEARLTRLDQIEYAGRVTYFGEYVHWEGKLSYPVSRFIVAQELGGGFPSVHCIREWRTSTSLFQSPIRTGDQDFERVFTTFSNEGEKALALLGGGLSALLLEGKTQAALKSFELVGNTAVMLFEPIQMRTEIRFAGPEVLFRDYRYIKGSIISYLEMAKRIGDAVSR